MQSPQMSWRDAIRAALQYAGKPQTCQDLTQVIHTQGYRILSGATPEQTVASQLSQMTRSDQALYDPTIRRTSRGYFEFIADTLSSPGDEKPLEEQDYIEEDDDPTDIDSKIRVACYGLHWDRGRVDWAKPQLLGQAYPGASQLDFADQNGIYVLHQNRFPVYVGQTTDSLYSRLRHHDRTKAARWETFSWFGLREVDDYSGDLPSATKSTCRDVQT